MKIRRRCLHWLIVSAVGLLSLVIVPAALGIREPSPGCSPGRGVRVLGPDQYALLLAGGRKVVVVCTQHGSGRQQIRVTLSQASTGAFGEGILDLAASQAAQGWRLTVESAPGAPSFSDGTAQASVVYQSVHQQWLGELILAAQLPSHNPLAASFRDRLRAPTTKSETDWATVVIGVIVALAIGALVGVAVGRRRRPAAS